MAESILKFVRAKLGDVVVKEVLLLYNVDKQVETVSRELGRIQAFLKDTDMTQLANERQKHWIKEVRDVAFSIEDAIDTFLLEVPQEPQESGMVEREDATNIQHILTPFSCCWPLIEVVIDTVKRMIKKTKKLPAVHKLVCEINQIETRMKEIEESRIRYKIENLGDGSGENRLPIRPPVLPDIDPDIIGFKADQEHLVKELLDETIKRRSVVSIWGPGGLGKTTLAQKVYNCAKGQFGVPIWVAISQNFKVIDVLRNIAQQLKPPIKLGDQPKDVFLTQIHMSLRGKKYVIVLDDVWTSDLWTQIGATLPDENYGSRVLITTRFFDVCKDADPTCEPHKLGFLTKELSRELMLKTIFPNQDPIKSSFDDISDILDNFIHKCGGLPLALVVLGGLLSKKPRSYIAWNNLFQTMSWHAEGKNCSEIIGTSYEDLPFALKSCFMYCGAFPEDYIINAPSLLHMWIAEGFIPEEDNRTPEETAESFLEDLVQRSMVQVVYRSDEGSITAIRIHDLLRDLALHKAKEDNFLVVCSNPGHLTSLRRARRIAIHYSDCDQLPMSQNLRTLLCFHAKRIPNCSKQRLLKVVRIGDDTRTKIEIGMFEELTQLRYLNLIGMLSGECEEKYMEKVIGSMKFLQTLDFEKLSRWTNDGDEKVELPDGAWHIKTLRQVYQNGLGPPPSAELTNLQTLISMHVRESWKTKLPHMPNLRTLNLGHTSSSQEVVNPFLATLYNLLSLKISGKDIPSNIFDMRDFPFYKNLQSLTLQTDDFFLNPTMNLHEDMLPPHLTVLCIIRLKFQQDLMPILEKLRCLKRLILFSTFQSKKMRCSSGGFSQLEFLWMMGFEMEEWEIEDGALPILKTLNIDGCGQLGVPQGLQYLTNLQQLSWPYGKNPNYLVRRVCQHVPSLLLRQEQP